MNTAVRSVSDQRKPVDLNILPLARLRDSASISLVQDQRATFEHVSLKAIHITLPPLPSSGGSRAAGRGGPAAPHPPLRPRTHRHIPPCRLSSNSSLNGPRFPASMLMNSPQTNRTHTHWPIRQPASPLRIHRQRHCRTRYRQCGEQRVRMGPTPIHYAREIRTVKALYGVSWRRLHHDYGHLWPMRDRARGHSDGDQY